MTQHFARISLYLLGAFAPALAFAQQTGTEELLCALVEFLLGQFGAIMGTLAVVMIGFAMLRGKMEWHMGMVIMICIIGMFASLQIVQSIADATGNGGVQICPNLANGSSNGPGNGNNNNGGNGNNTSPGSYDVCTDPTITQFSTLWCDHACYVPNPEPPECIP